jgi:hypothetical protein
VHVAGRGGGGESKGHWDPRHSWPHTTAPRRFASPLVSRLTRCTRACPIRVYYRSRVPRHVPQAAMEFDIPLSLTDLETPQREGALAPVEKIDVASMSDSEANSLVERARPPRTTRHLPYAQLPLRDTRPSRASRPAPPYIKLPRFPSLSNLLPVGPERNAWCLLMLVHALSVGLTRAPRAPLRRRRCGVRPMRERRAVHPGAGVGRARQCCSPRPRHAI